MMLPMMSLLLPMPPLIELTVIPLVAVTSRSIILRLVQQQQRKPPEVDGSLKMTNDDGESEACKDELQMFRRRKCFGYI